ncbi:unnamed protein product [Rhizophagus irregularis]|nr:unnamed protein product [Rhizophagus irregularis]CAB5319986.1 unnamed protein product [Rhizophagus irregularis]
MSTTLIKKLIYSMGQEEHFESFDCEIAFVQIISIEDFDGSVKKIADIIKNIICEKSMIVINQKKRIVFIIFTTNAYKILVWQKNLKKLKQRDKWSIERFDCNGILKIKIDIDSKTAIVQLYHDLIYDRPEKSNISQEIKSFIKDRLCQTPTEIFSQLEINNLNLTQKQCYYWWTELIKKEFQKDPDQLKSSLLLLKENNKETIMQDIVGDIKYFAFITPYLFIIKRSLLMQLVDGAGLAAAYLFLDNAKKDEGVRTEILTKFLFNLKNLDCNLLNIF